jgi:asparagine synthase (glutamine-hydrolysing)
MCGIVGIWSFDEPVETGELKQLTALLVHRGPDDFGVELIDPKLGFGHTRLSIIDLTPRGHQPMRDPVNGNVTTYNGEIYNYRELRRELVACGHQFQSASDTEVLLKAYAQWGTDCLGRFQGMFAFALWDQSKKAIFAARDRLGIKPLYYLQDRDRLMIASEIKVFHAYLQRTGELRLNEEALPYYLTMRCVPTDQTLMGKVKRVRAGCYLWADQSGTQLEEKPYWSLKEYASERPISEGDALEELEARLRCAVKRRLVADVPVGCFLSGGVDSSFVTLLASQESNSRIHSFSADFEEDGYSEKKYFDYVANVANTEQHVFTLTSRTFLEFLDDWVFFMDDLVSDPSSLPLYFVAREARRNNIKVVLSGEGADELLGGYESYAQVQRYNRWQPLTRRLAWAGQLLTGNIDRKDLLWRLGSSFPFRGTAYVFGESYRDRFLKTDFSLDGWVNSVYAQARSVDPINQMLYFDLATRIPSDLLIRTDRITMAASVECRVPFLDHELVEVMLRVPGRLKINNGTSKYLLKRLASRFFPEQMIHRPKMGFSTPLALWFREELKPLLENIFLLERRIASLNYAAVEAMLNEHWLGRGRHEGRIWNLLALELWYRRWIEGQECPSR